MERASTRRDRFQGIWGCAQCAKGSARLAARWTSTARQAKVPAYACASGCDQTQYLVFAWRERLGGVWRAHLAHEACGSLRRQLDLAGGRGFDRSKQLINSSVFEKVADGARSHGADHGRVLEDAGQGN